MFRLLLVAVILAGTSAIAAAQGYCLSREKRDSEAERLDDVAKSAGDHEPSGGLLWCVLEGPDHGFDVEPGKAPDPRVKAAFRKRALAACTIIAARTPTTQGGIVDACTNLLVEDGTKKLGRLDLVARIFARPTTWSAEPTLRAIATTKDPRARTTIIDAVRLALKEVAGKKLDIGSIGGWIQFRVDALAALELVGTKADLPVVDEIVASINNLENIVGMKDSHFIQPAAKTARAVMSKR